MEAPHLEISPAELCFVYEHDSELRNVLHLRNRNDGRCLAFKVKCNNQSRYLVRPTSGIIKPGAAINIKVYMVAQVAYSDELRSCKDRFLIQTVPVRSLSEAGLDPAVFASPARQEYKINVTVAPPLALRSVLEGEIRAFASQQGVDGHRQCMRKFLELLLARGVLSQSQVLLAFGVVAELFEGVRSSSTTETMAATRADGLSKFVARSNSGGPSSLSPATSAQSNGHSVGQGRKGLHDVDPGVASRAQDGSPGSSPRSGVFHEDPEAKPLFPSYPGGVPSAVLAAAAAPRVYAPAGRTFPTVTSVRPNPASNPSKLWDFSSRHTRAHSAGSEASLAGGVAEPPPTPSSPPATLAAASSLYSTSLASDRSALPTLRGAGDKLAGSAAYNRTVSADMSDAEDFQDASETLVDQNPKP